MDGVRRHGGGEAAILDAAEALFAERGFDGASIQQIATRAGVSKATVFHHFPSKRALYRAVVARACQNLAEMLDRIEREPAGDALMGLVEYRRLQWREMRRHEAVARLILRELALGDADLARDLVEAHFGRQFRIVRSLVERAQQQGRLPQGLDPSLGALFAPMINVFFFLVWPMLAALPDADFAGRGVERAAEDAFDWMLRGWQAMSERTDSKGGARCEA